MLFYRARLEGCIAAVLSLRTGRVRGQSGLGEREGLARVVLWYALAPGGEVRLHRGWLYTGLPAGTRLEALGYQVDGSALLLSLRPVRPGRGAALRLEQIDQRFRLPFWLQSWGTGALRGVSASLRLSCEPRPEAMLLWGRLSLVIQGTGGPIPLRIPFCRLLAASVNEGLAWRAWGGVVGMTCSVSSDGTITGEAALAATCLGAPPPVPELSLPPAPAVVRELTGVISRVTAEQAGPGQALVSGAVELDAAWSDPDGQSRQTGCEVPFSALLSLPGLLEGDRLEAAARVDRVVRVGQGGGSRALLLLTASVTALRPVHLPLGGHFYQVEEVVGQGGATVQAETPLFPPPSPSRPERVPLAAGAPLPGPPDQGWSHLELTLSGSQIAQGGWRSAFTLRTPSARTGAALSGPLPAGSIAPLVGLQSVGDGGVRAGGRALRLPPGRPPPVPLRSPASDGGNLSSRTEIRLSAPAEALSGLWLRGGRRWEARLLVRQAGGARLAAEALAVPAQADQALWRPVAATAYPVAGQNSDPEVIQIDTIWQRVR